MMIIRWNWALLKQRWNWGTGSTSCLSAMKGLHRPTDLLCSTFFAIENVEHLEIIWNDRGKLYHIVSWNTFLFFQYVLSITWDAYYIGVLSYPVFSGLAMTLRNLAKCVTIYDAYSYMERSILGLGEHLIWWQFDVYRFRWFWPIHVLMGIGA